MKIPAFFAASLAVLIPNTWLCHGQTPEAHPLATTLATPAVKDSQALKTRKFKIPPDPGCFPGGHAPPSDPFDSKPPVKPDTRATLQSMGISFEALGSTASFNSEKSILTITNTAEQLEKTGNLFFPAVLQGQVHMEVFSLHPLTARKALIAHPKEAELYAWLDAELTKLESTVKLERHAITIVRDGQKAKTEGITEIPHPTEFDAPTVPQSMSLPVTATSTTSPAGNAPCAPWPRTGTKPHSIEFRNAGDTYELELTFGDEGKTVDLHVDPEITRRLGIAKFGLREDIYQPVYETQKCSAQVSGFIGQPILISTFSPPVNTGVPGGNKVDRTWLLFVTVKTPE